MTTASAKALRIPATWRRDWQASLALRRVIAASAQASRHAHLSPPLAHRRHRVTSLTDPDGRFADMDCCRAAQADPLHWCHQARRMTITAKSRPAAHALASQLP